MDLTQPHSRGPRPYLKNPVHCRSRRKEALILAFVEHFSVNQSLLTSAPTFLKRALTRRQAELQIRKRATSRVGDAKDEAPIAEIIRDLDQDRGRAFGQVDGHDIAVEKGRAFVRIVVHQLSAEPYLAGVVGGKTQLRLLL